MYQVSKQNVELEMESPSVRPVRPVIPYPVHILLTDSVAMGHPLAMNPVALVSDLSAQNTTFLITCATEFVAERVSHYLIDVGVPTLILHSLPCVL